MTHPELPTLLTLTLTPHSRRTQLYCHLVAVGVVDWERVHPDRHCHPLFIDWYMNGEAGRRRRDSTDAHWWVKEVSTFSFIDYLDDLSMETRTPIDGHKLTVTGTSGVYFKSQTSIFTYWSIDWSIDISIYKLKGKKVGKSVGQKAAGSIDKTDRKYASTGRTAPKIYRTKYQQSQLSQSRQSQLSILLFINSQKHWQKGALK